MVRAAKMLMHTTLEDAPIETFWKHSLGSVFHSFAVCSKKEEAKSYYCNKIGTKFPVFPDSYNFGVI